MSKVSIVYWSGTGNTEEMANLILQGVKELEGDTNLYSVDSIDLNAIENSETLVLGCPSMGDEVLEESEFQPFMDNIYDKLEGKNIALFGSYGWGDGEWMRSWEESIKNSKGKLLFDGLIVNYAPEDEEECIEYGRKIASA